MSHTIAIKTEIKNWDILTKTLESLNWAIKENSKLRTYPSDPDRNKVYEYVAVNPMSTGYDVGIIRTGDDVALHCDFFGGSIAKTLGQNFSELKIQYVIKLTEEYYEEVEIMERLADGSLIIEADDGM